MSTRFLNPRRLEVRRKTPAGMYELVAPADVRPGDKLYREPWTHMGRFRWIRLTRTEAAAFAAGRWTESAVGN